MTAQFPILLVDDDPDIADILNRAARTAFAEAQFVHVRSFGEAAAYLEGLRGRGPRLVLLDIDLQTELSGLDFLSLMRGHDQGRLVPVVVFSASTRLADQALSRGANAFARKPSSYAAWKAYVEQLRHYWFETVTTPNLWFDNESDQ